MKRIVTILMVLVLATSLLTGCMKIPKNVVQAIQSAKASAGSSSSSPKDTSSPDAQSSSDSGSQDTSTPEALKTPKTPSDGYSNYITVKGDAYERISTASEKTDALTMAVGMGMLGIAMVDLSLISLTALTEDTQSAQMALGILGMTDVKITGSGGDYTITYKDSEGGAIKQTCKYDVSKDQLSSTVSDGSGKVSMFFEYVDLGNGYASQYYDASGDSMQIIKCYFDKDNVAAFGIVTATAQPASIIGTSSFNTDFVKNDESYMILKDGKLSVFDKGTLTTG